jgi:hypothetical protein
MRCKVTLHLTHLTPLEGLFGALPWQIQLYTRASLLTHYAKIFMDSRFDLYTKVWRSMDEGVINPWSGGKKFFWPPNFSKYKIFFFFQKTIFFPSNTSWSGHLGGVCVIYEEAWCRRQTMKGWNGEMGCRLGNSPVFTLGSELHGLK